MKSNCKTKTIANVKLVKYLTMFWTMLLMTFATFAHQVDAYTGSCAVGPQYSVTATVSSVNASSNYRWQWKNASGVWNCFVNGANVINGNTYNVSGAVFNLTTTPGPIVFTNPNSGLQGLEIRMVISDGSGVNPCNLPAGNTWSNAAGVSNHFINVTGTGCATQTGCACTNGATNLLTNGSFESGTTGWSWAGGTITTGTGYVVCGAANGFLNWSAGTAWGWQQVTATAGNSYTASAYLGTHTAGIACSPRFYLSFYNSVGTLLSRVTANVTTDVDVSPYLPSLYSLTAIAPAGVSYLRVEVSINCNTMKMDAFCLTTTPTGSIGDRVWGDANGNGIQDAGETTGFTGVAVQLKNAAGTVIATTNTDANGNYLFTGLAAGNYTVVFPTNINGTQVTVQNAGADDNVDSDANQTTGETPVIVLAAGQNITNVDAGYCPTTLALGNRVWNDVNNNGINDAAGEAGIGSVTLNLYKDNNNDNVADGAAIATTTTDVNGFYQFSNLSPGNYIVGVVTPAGYLSSTINGGDPDNDINLDDNGQITVGNETRGLAITLTGGAEPDGTGATNTNTNITYDFGFYLAPTGSIGDRVWYDANGNGIQDATETTPITGVTVQLKNAAGTVIATTTTNGTGNYLFSGLAAGNYTVVFPASISGAVVTAPNVGADDNVDSDANQTTGETPVIVLGAGQNITNVDAGYCPTTLALGDRAYYDLNNNGLRDANENGIPSLTVNLYKDNNNDNVPDGAAIATTTTDANGNYRFDNLVPGNYIVGITPPATYTSSSLTGVDPDNDVDLDDNGTNLVGAEWRGLAITLTGGGETLESGNYNHTYDFGFYQPIASLGDKVWRDDDKDGVQDAGEPGVSGITVSLYDNTGKLVGTTSTDAYGNYLFTNLLPGDYTVGFTLPANYTFTTSTGTSETDAANSDVNPITGNTTTVTLSGGENQLNIDAGIIFNTPPVKANIGDRVWLDTNKNGIQDSGEPGVSGVTVTLFDNAGNIVATTITDANGNYLFTDVTPGTGYTIGFTAPAGTVFSPKDATTDGNDSDADPITGRTAPFTVVAGVTDLSFDAGLYPQVSTKASLGDKVWNDLNKDGKQDANEPGIAGVTVNLYDAAGTTLLATTKTDAFGNYIFTNLNPGSYVVEFVKPVGYTSSPKDAGTDDAKDSDADVTTGKTAAVTLLAGDRNTTVDAGMYLTTPPGLLQLGDKVFNDENRDGVQGATEDGISGVTVTLYQNGPDGLPGTADDVKLKSTSTDVNGNYIFTDLAASTGASTNYNVQFSNLPNGYSFTTQDQTANGGNDTNDSDPNSVTGRTGSINLTANNLTVDAGLVQGVAAGKGTLGDRVWYDLPGGTTGVQDANETGVSGVTVKLYKDANNDGVISGAELTAIATTTTNALGNYIFGGLDAGTYQVGFSNLPAGFTLTTKDAGTDDAKDSDGNTLGAAVAGNTATAGTSYSGLVNLAQGEDNLTVDLGIVPPANTNTLGGDVWKDSNNDGNQTPGEQPVKGVMVTLYNAAGQPIATTVTDENGKYLFVGLPDGSYSVGFTSLPAGYNFTNQSATNDATGSDANVTTGRTGTVTLGPTNRNDTSLDAGLVTTRAALGNYVWFDANSNGVQDATEKGISGVTVTLTRPGFGLDGIAGNADDALPVATAITDATGNYFFGNLAAGNYVVGFSTIPNNLVFTQQNTPGDNQNDTNSDANPATGLSSSIALVAGETDLTVDAGVKPVLTGAVGDFVWNDLNGNGVQDPGEPGVAGVLVTLYDAANNPVGSAITDGNGAYLITNVPAGTGYYAIFSNLPTGGIFTAADQTASGGNDTNDSDANTTTGRTTSTITVVAGETNTTVDAGILLAKLNLGNVVWYDQNNDGIKQATESGIVGATVNLYADANNDNIADGAAIATTTTIAGGVYGFANLYPGNYIVGVIIPAGYAVVTTNGGDPDNDVDNDNNGTNTSVAGEVRSSAVTLTAGTEPAVGVDGDGTNGNLTVDFGFRGTGALGDFVWNDVNQNGIQDAGELGIGGVTVTLTYPNGQTATTTTNAAGAYSFTNLAPGTTYSVAFSAPANYVASPSNVVTAGANDTNDSDPVGGIVTGITVTAGATNNTIDAGFYNCTIVSGISGPASICAGEAALFVATPAPLNTTFTWTFSGGTPATATGSSASAVWTTPGVYAVTLTVTNATGCSSTYSTSINITQAVFASAGPDADICQGSSTTLAGSGPAGATYSWTIIAGDPTSIDNGANQANVLVSPLVTTVYQLTVSQNGCTRTDQVTVFINVNKNPTANAGPNRTVCAGTPVVIGGSPTGTPPVASPTAPLGYIWSPATGLNDPTIANPTATITIPGTYNYQVIVYNLLTGCSDTSVTSVIVLPKVLSIGSKVWYDQNNDGIRQATETPIANTAVKLYEDTNGDNVADGPAVASTTTNNNGDYNFSGLCAGNYIVGVTIPAGYAVVTTNGGDPDNNIDDDNNGVNTSVAGEVRSLGVTVAPGTEPDTNVDGDGKDGNNTVDFGLKGTGGIGNFVWYDFNRDGIQDPTETGISGVTVTLTYPNGQTVTTTTDVNGAYSFLNLAPAANYTVSFSTPLDMVAADANVVTAGATDDNDSDPVGGVVNNVPVTAGVINNSVDAGFHNSCSSNIIGNVWHDIDGMDDNIVDSVGSSTAAPIPIGLRVSLISNTTGKVVKSGLVSGLGKFSFTNVPPGNYYIVLSTDAGVIGNNPPSALLPRGWRNTGEKLGTGPGRDTQINGLLNVNIGYECIFNANFGIKFFNSDIGID